MVVHRTMDDNGFVINESMFIPREILTTILSFVHPHTLITSCRLVCKNWKQLVETDVWKFVTRTPPHNQRPLTVNPKYPYPLGRNLLRNNCAQENLQHWSAIESTYWYGYPRLLVDDWDEYDDDEDWIENIPNNTNRRPVPVGDNFEKAEALRRRFVSSSYHHLELDEHGAGWLVENVPVGADPLPVSNDFQGYTSCFVTSHRPVHKIQEIDLVQNGISGRLMDWWQPKIIVSEWWAGRYDCGSRYSLEVFLLDEEKYILHQDKTKRVVEQWKGRNWEKVVITFQNYGPGVRYIIFEHGGSDTKFWAGHYGSKMSGGVVKLVLPPP